MPQDRHVEDEQQSISTDAQIEGRSGEFDFTVLKSGGFIKQRQRDLFTVRLRCPGGRVPLERLRKIVEVAEGQGNRYVHLSVRQSIEIPYVHWKDFSAVQTELAVVGQEVASCGPRCRVPTACSGCEYNPNGLNATQQMTELVDQRFFGTELPHKFKVSFSGCPIDCARTSERDLGFQGAVRPQWDEESCIGCRLCEHACQEGAIESDPDTGQPHYFVDKCLYCGDCIRVCPTEAWQADEIGWMVRCGGKHGRHPMQGHKIAEFVSDQQIPEIIQAIMDWYGTHGADKGRTRIGTLLQDPTAWEDFLRQVAPVLGAKALQNPSAPTSLEIHFEQ